MKDLLQTIYYRLFLWSGARLFPVVAVYDPESGQLNNNVEVIHFAVNESKLFEACSSLVLERMDHDPDA